MEEMTNDEYIRERIQFLTDEEWFKQRKDAPLDVLVADFFGYQSRKGMQLGNNSLT